MKKNKITYVLEINDLIALCHVIDDYQEFEDNFMQLNLSKYNRTFINNLWNISNGKMKYACKKEKKFYNENKKIIEIINKYSNIQKFIEQNYSIYGTRKSEFNYFYNYLINHRNEIDNIIILLEKIKKLNFSSVELNENADFTQNEYHIRKNLRYNNYIKYVNNIEIIPNYNANIKYKTSSSDYEMHLDIVGENICVYGNPITLKSLLINPETLPDKIDKKSTYEYIINLYNNQKEKINLLKNSVNLSAEIHDLEYQLTLTTQAFDKIDDVKDKEELINTLQNIKINILKLKEISEIYNNRIIEQEPMLTKELLEKEKTLYLKRKEENLYDWCY